MEVDAQSPPPVAKPPNASPAKSSKKGKGRGRATRSNSGAPRTPEAAPAITPAAPANPKGDDSDVDMSGGDGSTEGDGVGQSPAASSETTEFDMVGVLDHLPREPVYMVWPTTPAASAVVGAGATNVSATTKVPSTPEASSERLPPLLQAFTSLLRSLAATEWLAGALTLLTRWAHSRLAQSAVGLQAASRLGPILVSGNGRKVLQRLMKLHRHVLMEVRLSARVTHHIR